MPAFFIPLTENVLKEKIEEENATSKEADI